MFAANVAEQAAPQLIPVGVLTTVPPAEEVTVNVTGARNTGVTVAAAASEMVQVVSLAGAQLLLQPPKT